jgi:hypothetical protein
MTYCFHHTLLNRAHVTPLQEITPQETAIHYHCCEKFNSHSEFFYPLSSPRVHYLLHLNFITFFMILTQIILLTGFFRFKLQKTYSYLMNLSSVTTYLFRQLTLTKPSILSDENDNYILQSDQSQIIQNVRKCDSITNHI